MGRQAKLKAERREEKRAAAAERVARRRADNYTRAPSGGIVPVAIPSLPTADLDAWARPMLPEFVPAGWRFYCAALDGWSFVGGPPAHLQLIVSAAVELDGKRWLHCSLSATGRVPTWDEQVATKEAFCGPGSLAVLLIPPRAEWVNIHPHCLHWWICADERPVPDFTRGGRTI